MIKLDKEYPIAFNVNVLSNAQKETGMNPFSEESGSPIFLRALAYYGIKEGHRLQGDKFEKTIEDIGALMGTKEMLSVMDLFLASQPTGEPGE